jgi:hypothetical protein
MVYGSASVGNYPTSTLAFSARSAGRISLPVAPSQYIYSHFEHVGGVPAPEGQRGVSVNKLKILDVLIDQLVQIKKKPDPAFGAAGPISEERIDALIEQYEKEIRVAQKANLRMPYTPAPAAPSGAVFNLVA